MSNPDDGNNNINQNIDFISEDSNALDALDDDDAKMVSEDIESLRIHEQDNIVKEDEKSKEISDLVETVTELQSKLEEQKREIETNVALRSTIGELWVEIDGLQSMIQALTATIDEKDQILVKRDGRIAELEMIVSACAGGQEQDDAVVVGEIEDNIIGVDFIGMPKEDA